jgi:hypothetical protein
VCDAAYRVGAGEDVGYIQAAMDPAAVLTALAELAPARRDRVYDVVGGRMPLWLTDPDRPPRRRATERLAATDALHHDERILRRGWVFVVGTVDVDGTQRRVILPLLSEPVRLRRTLRGYGVVPAGDLELTPLVEDPELAVALELDRDGDRGPGDGGPSAAWLDNTWPLEQWIRTTSAAAGLDVATITAGPPRRGRDRGDHGLVAVRRAGLYVAREVTSDSLREVLRRWAGREGLDATALAAVYRSGDGDRAEQAEQADPDAEVLSPLPLNQAQLEVVRRARAEPVAVVSGPPGSGKSHAVAAAALDTVDRGGSVLLATQSSHAADVLGELLNRYPGPTPVLFGDAEFRDAIAAELARGADAGHGSRTLRADRETVAAAAERVRLLRSGLVCALEQERRAAEYPIWEPIVPTLQTEVPGAFDDATDLDEVARLLAQSRAPVHTTRGHLRRRWHRWRLRARLRVRASAPPDRLRLAVDAARAAQAVSQLSTTGGTDLSRSWEALHRAEQELAQAVGTAMRHRARSAERWKGSGRRSAAALAAALRAGRNRRRQLLAGMDGPALVRALPLWVGTAADTGDLLPPVPGMFDLVILDEASHLDQIRAAPVLARGRRALVVGDPRQLRFVSFVADVDIATTLHRHGLDDRADVRRVSAFDLATSAAPVTWLNEHYRSAPHLIGFSAHRFYDGHLTVATTHPSTDALDVIDVRRVPDGTVTDGVNHPEVAATVATVRDLADDGVVGIGVITPFRAQADALERALLEEFRLPELERLALRVGTVHAFQGSEADTVVVSLGLVDDDPPARTRFVNGPHLFNVMITRARRRMVVVTSLTVGSGRDADLVDEYLAYCLAGPGEPAPGGEPDDEWTRALFGELVRADVPAQADYPVGRWTVDICAGAGEAAVGLLCRVHPDGSAVHVARQRSLMRAGWRLVDAFSSRWDGDPARAAVDLTTGVLAPCPPLSSTQVGDPPGEVLGQPRSR